MDSRQFIESGALETYAMGFATEQEAKLVAELAARYPEVKAELVAIEESMEKFDRLNAMEVPVKLKDEIRENVLGTQFSALGSDRSVSSSLSTSLETNSVENQERGAKIRSLNGSGNGQPMQNNFYKYAAAAALILVIGASWYAVILRNQISDKDDQLSQLKADNELLNANLATMDTLAQTLGDKNLALLTEVNLLKKPDMKSIELKGMEVAPDAKAMAYANTKTGEVYLEIMNLPSAPEGMQYQFWGIVDDEPVDAGMIPVDENDLAGIHPMTTVPNAVAYAISLEPMGGSPQPSGKIYVMGNP